MQARPCPCFPFQDDLLESEPDPELESESEEEPEELAAGDLSLSGVAGATSLTSAIAFSFRLRFFGAARSALELLVLFEACLAACFFPGLAGSAVPPASPELLAEGSAVEADPLRPRPLPRTAKAAKGVESAATAALCRASAPVSEKSNLATNQGT